MTVRTSDSNDKVHNVSEQSDVSGDVPEEVSFSERLAASHPVEEETHPPNFVEVQKDTMQVPFGLFSMLNALMAGDEKAFDAAIYQCYNGFSHWDFGESHSMSFRFLGKMFNVTHQYVQQAVSRLTQKWMDRLSGKHKISKFKLKHHLCDETLVPLDRDGRPAKCAMPRGEGGLFERLAAGDICWKSLIIWMLLKLRSDWTTGITDSVSLPQLCDWTGFGRTTVCNCIKELEWAGMLGRLERRPQEAQAYQLFPKPYANRHQRTPEAYRTWRNMRAMGDWRYSFNKEWRVNVETLDIQHRTDTRKPFRAATDYEKYVKMPKSIRRDFDLVVRFHSDLVANLNRDPCPV